MAGGDQTDITLTTELTQCQNTWRDPSLGEPDWSLQWRMMDICRQLSDSEKTERVIEDHKRRKKVKISTENIRDGGEWDFRTGPSHWTAGGEREGEPLSSFHF